MLTVKWTGQMRMGDIVKRVVILTIVIAMLSGLNALAALPANPKNVLFIAVDDLKPSLGCYGDPHAITPNIDRLARSGVVFSNAHCQFSVCGPSRASLTTSLMPEEVGVRGFTNMRCDLPDLITLPQHFRNNGYETAATGKIHDYRTVGNPDPANPCGRTLNGSQIDDVLSWSIAYNNGGGGIGSTKKTSADDPTKTFSRAAESVDSADTNFTDGKICNTGISLLNTVANQYKSTGKPFFLGIGFKKPHLPFLSPKKYWDYYNRNDFQVHPFQTDPLNVTPYTFNNIQEMRGNYYLRTNPQDQALTIPQIIPDDQQLELIHGYYASVSFIDAQVGRVLDALEAHGIADDTVIVFWGDHGFHLGDHNEWGKHTNMEQATRCPLIISCPWLGQSGTVTISPANLYDIYPTLCELTGLTIPEQPLSKTVLTGRPLKGKSLAPILQNPDALVQQGAISDFGYSARGYAFRTKQCRYVEWISGNSIAAKELYDYRHDPYETVNYAVDNRYATLIYHLSQTMRDPQECRGCDILKGSSPLSVPSGAIRLSTSQESFSSSVLNATGKDTADAVLTMAVDFDDSSVTTPQVLMELGGAVYGLSIVYEQGNILTLSVSADGVQQTVNYGLDAKKIALNNLEITAVIYIDHSGSDDLIALVIDRHEVISIPANLADNDFIGSDSFGFGMTGGASTGGRTEGVMAAFTSGTIDYDYGLWYTNTISDWPLTATELPLAATNPLPVGGATSQDIHVDLSWCNGGGATSYDVYLNGVRISQGQPGTTYDPGALADNTAYAWRVDSINAAGKTLGATWTFSTADAVCPEDHPDLTGDCVITIADFVLLAGNWLECGWDITQRCEDQ